MCKSLDSTINAFGFMHVESVTGAASARASAMNDTGTVVGLLTADKCGRILFYLVNPP
jgi:hypothetical protein